MRPCRDCTVADDDKRRALVASVELGLWVSLGNRQLKTARSIVCRDLAMSAEPSKGSKYRSYRGVDQDESSEAL